MNGIIGLNRSVISLQFVSIGFIIVCKMASSILLLLQSTHMASQQINEEAVYSCTGNPLPTDIEQIAYWLLNESFATSYKRS